MAAYTGSEREWGFHFSSLRGNGVFRLEREGGVGFNFENKVVVEKIIMNNTTFNLFSYNNNNF